MYQRSGQAQLSPQQSCSDNSYRTQNFDICPTSTTNFQSLAKNPRLQCQFAIDEDQFLFFEKQAVQYGVPSRDKMTAKDAYMKVAYPNLNFDYHQLHIRQGTLPLQVINERAWVSLGFY